MSSAQSRALIPRSFSNNDLSGAVVKALGDLHPITPPITPPKERKLLYSASRSPSPISPTIHVHAAPPWYNSRNLLIAAFGVLGLSAFGIHTCGPLIHSAADALSNFGHVVGSVGNMGDALSESVKQTNRISGGIADGIGQVWCSFMSCKSDGIVKSGDSLGSSDNYKKMRSSSLLEGANLLPPLEELGLSAPNLTASLDMMYFSEYITEAPLASKVSKGWSEPLRRASKLYLQHMEAKTNAYATALTVVQGLVDHFNNAVAISDVSAFSTLLSYTFHRREFLMAELQSMVNYTSGNYVAAALAITEADQSAAAVYDVGQSISISVHHAIFALERQRVLAQYERLCRWAGICAATVEEIDWTLKLLRELSSTLDMHINEAAQIHKVATQLNRELGTFVRAFHVTAGVKKDKDNEEDIFLELKGEPWLILRKLEPYLTELAKRLKELPVPA